MKIRAKKFEKTINELLKGLKRNFKDSEEFIKDAMEMWGDEPTLSKKLEKSILDIRRLFMDGSEFSEYIFHAILTIFNDVSSGKPLHQTQQIYITDHGKNEFMTKWKRQISTENVEEITNSILDNAINNQPTKE